MTSLPQPPETVSASSRCVVHAACRGDMAGAQADMDERAERLRRLERAIGHPIQPADPAPPHRARITLRPGTDGVLGQALPGTHDLRPVAWCGLAHPALVPAMAALPPMPRGLASVELRTDGHRVVAAARSRKPKLRRRLGQALLALDLPVDGLALDGGRLSGEPTLQLEVAGITHRISPATFFQVHLETNRVLVAAVLEELADATAVLDLYAGCGNLGLPLAATRSLTIIESSQTACADARRTARSHDLTVDVRKGDAGAFQAGDAFFDAVVLDPPRAGAPGVLAQVVLTRPATIVFVSCNPGHLGRDLRPALTAGYTITRLQALDMFPLTPHVELLAVLRRPT